LNDGDGNPSTTLRASLVKKIKPDNSKTIYVGGIYEVDKTSGGSVTRTVTYYPVAGAMRINSTLYYVLKDHLGSASVVTDASGNVLGEQRYYPFGETRLTSGTIYTDKLFTGQREIAGLGIYHYQARFYSPKIGRFLSPDSVVPGYANPQSLNRFSYVYNAPLNYVDPTGHDADYFCSGSDDYSSSCTGYVEDQATLGSSLGGGNDGEGGGNEEGTPSLSEILTDLLNSLSVGLIGVPVLIHSESSNSNDLGIHPAIWTPRNERDWQALARRLRINRDKLGNNVESCKKPADVPPDGDVQIDDETGDIYYRGEHIGNAYDGC